MAFRVPAGPRTLGSAAAPIPRRGPRPLPAWSAAGARRRRRRPSPQTADGSRQRQTAPPQHETQRRPAPRRRRPGRRPQGIRGGALPRRGRHHRRRQQGPADADHRHRRDGRRAERPGVRRGGVQPPVPRAAGLPQRLLHLPRGPLRLLHLARCQPVVCDQIKRNETTTLVTARLLI